MCWAALRNSMPIANLQRFEKCLYTTSRVDCNCSLLWPGVGLCECRRGQGRWRTVSYFALQSYCTWNPSTRAAKPLAAINEGVGPRRKIKRPSFLVWSHITSWFAIALVEIRTRRILEKGRTESSLGAGGRRNSPLFSTSDQIVLGKRKSSKFN